MTPATQAVVLGPWTPGARIPVALESVRGGFPSVAQERGADRQTPPA